MFGLIVLGIETSGPIGSVALCREDDLLASYTFPEGARHARDIVPAVDRVVTESGVSRHDIAAVAVSEGPGSFTGLRVGITCAKALAYALGWKTVGVPSLEVAVQNVCEEPAAQRRFACPVLDARRERVYGTVFQWDGQHWRDTTGVLLKGPQELAETIPGGAVVFGTGVRAYPEAFPAGRFRIGDRRLEMGRADAVAQIGLRMLRAGRQIAPMALVPRYYRATAPEEKLQTGAKQ